MSKRRRSLLKSTGRPNSGRSTGRSAELQDEPPVEPPVPQGDTTSEAPDVESAAPPASEADLPPRPDVDAAFFGKREEEVNEAAEKPVEATLPKNFEGEDDDDWYMRTGQPAPSRVAEIYAQAVTEGGDGDILEPDEEAPSSDNPVLVYLPALAMVTFVLFAVALLLLIGMAF